MSVNLIGISEHYAVCQPFRGTKARRACGDIPG